MISREKRSRYLDFDVDSVETYIDYLTNEKLSGSSSEMSWEDISDLVFIKFGVLHSRHWYARRVDKIYPTKATISAECNKPTGGKSEPIGNYVNRLVELQKLKAKISDERVQVGAYVRKLAREESLKEIALSAVKEMSSKKLLSSPSTKTSASSRDKEGILVISDWHLGIVDKSFLNEYSPEIAAARLSCLQQKVIDRLSEGDIDVLRVVNLGDMIAGRIHSIIKLHSRYDVITQIMKVSELIAELLSNLSAYCKISYYSCNDNHSRLEPDKSEALEPETLTRITDWYLRERLKNNQNITFVDNEFGPDIITFNSLGHNVIGVHGDKDKKSQLDRLRLMVNKPCDLLLIAHLHHPWMEESNNTRIIGNGSLMGVDEYSKNLRLSSKASQTLIVSTPENVTEEIRILNLQ